MILHDFADDWVEMKETAIQSRMLKVLDRLKQYVEESPLNAVSLCHDGFLDPLAMLEAEDAFGTEGMEI